MEQNNMWKRYLMRGLIISLITLFNACSQKTSRWQQVGDFYFVNETNYSISYPTEFEIFNILPKSTTFFKQTITKGGNVIVNSQISDYQVPLQNFSGTIKFNNAKCLNNNIGNEHSIQEIKNYVTERTGDNTFKFTYTFTEADYNKAAICP